MSVFFGSVAVVTMVSMVAMAAVMLMELPGAVLAIEFVALTGDPK